MIESILIVIGENIVAISITIQCIVIASTISTKIRIKKLNKLINNKKKDE